MRRLVKEELGGSRIDAREAAARLDYLYGEKTDLEDAIEAAGDDLAEAKAEIGKLEKEDEPDPDELSRLRDAVTEAENDLKEAEEALDAWEGNYGEEYNCLDSEEDTIRCAAEEGETLIKEGDFTDYAMELCCDLGYIPSGFPDWIEVDWEATAENIKADYVEVELHCGTYLVRSC